MKPFLNYIGSKIFLLKTLNKILPKDIRNYYEPFVGGGSVLLYVNEKYDIKKNYINDKDGDLIIVYKIIKKSVNKLLEKLNEINKQRGPKNFKKLINIFNNNKTDKILLSAIYIFISKRAFNSVFKYRKDKTINPSYSKYNNKKLSIYNEKNMKDISKLLKKTIIKNQDYKSFLQKKKPRKGDFVFFDPPYYDLKDVKTYYKNIFNINDFKELKKICDQLDKNNVKFMITLNKHSELKNLFKNYKIRYFTKTHSKISKGNKIEKEMIVTNY